jgi:hypothetical protein
VVTLREREDLELLASQQAVNLEQLAEVDRKGRPPRTAGQVGLGGSVFVIIDYILRGYLKIDLDPVGAGTEMPPLVTVAFTVLASYLVAVYMNRKGNTTIPQAINPEAGEVG